MLVKENLVSAARLYAKKTEGKVYPFSVTQLPRCIKAVAWKNTFQQNDDSSAFQRIIYGKTQLQQAKNLTKELMEDREKVFESIIKGGKFKKWVKNATLKEAVNAIANGQSITTTENKIGDSGKWLKSWDRAQKAVTNEQCSTDTAKKAITLLKKHFPYKKNKAGERIERNCRATWRTSLTEQFEALGLIEKYSYFEENDILSGPPIHDDVPCEMFSNREDRLRISRDLTERIKKGIRGYPHQVLGPRRPPPPERARVPQHGLHRQQDHRQDPGGVPLRDADGRGRDRRQVDGGPRGRRGGHALRRPRHGVAQEGPQRRARRQGGLRRGRLGGGAAARGLSIAITPHPSPPLTRESGLTCLFSYLPPAVLD